MKSINYQHIFDFSLPPLQLLHRVLAAAGFLLDDRGEHLEFSSNSAMHWDRGSGGWWPPDPEFLKSLSKDYPWFSVEGMRVHSRRPITPQDLVLFFDRQVGTEETGEINPTWEYFINYRGKGPASPTANIPASRLDARIAGLVRAFKTAGVDTWISCHGHLDMDFGREFTPFVGINNPYAALWLQQLLQHRYAALAAATNCRFEEYNYVVFPGLKSFPDSGWRAIFELGWRIYQEREALRNRKLRLYDRIAGTPLEARLAGASGRYEAELQELMAQEAARPESVADQRSAR